MRRVPALTRAQLLGIERLYEVVVCPGIEARDDVGALRFAGEEDQIARRRAHAQPDQLAFDRQAPHDA
jgi:hypothetical protein